MWHVPDKATMDKSDPSTFRSIITIMYTYMYLIPELTLLILRRHKNFNLLENKKIFLIK